MRQHVLLGALIDQRPHPPRAAAARGSVRRRPQLRQERGRRRRSDECLLPGAVAAVELAVASWGRCVPFQKGRGASPAQSYLRGAASNHTGPLSATYGGALPQRWGKSPAVIGSNAHREARATGAEYLPRLPTEPVFGKLGVLYEVDREYHRRQRHLWLCSRRYEPDPARGSSSPPDRWPAQRR